MFPCSKCQVCPFVDRTKVFKDAKGHKQYELRDLINCSTDRVIYMLTCPCQKIYIGKTKRQLRIRIEHLRDIKREKDREKDPEKYHESPVAKHSLEHHQGKPDGLKSEKASMYSNYQPVEATSTKSSCRKKNGGYSL